MQTEWLLFFEQEPRRGNAVYYLLSGKRTVSNLFAGLQYQLLPWLQLYPKLSQPKFQAALQKLQQAGLLNEQNGDFSLTSSGSLQQQQLQHFFPQNFDGRWMGSLASFQQRILLAVQMLSESCFQNPRYVIPNVSFETRQLLKRWWHQNTETNWQQTAIQQLAYAFEQLSAEEANLLSQFFNGHAQVGLTLQQLAATQQASLLQLSLLAKDSWAALWRQLLQSTNSIWQPLLPPAHFLAASTQISYDLLLQGATLEQVAGQRHLKTSTIQEHLLEAAILAPNFNFAPLISAADLTTLKAATRHDLLNYQNIIEKTKLPFFTVRLFQIMRLRQNVTTGA